MAFRSVQADYFGYVIRTNFKARQINSAIESPGMGIVSDGETYDFDVEPFLDNKDGVLVLEIGDDFIAGVGFTRIGTWLQHH